MRAFPAPLYLLLFVHSSGDHFVDRRLHNAAETDSPYRLLRKEGAVWYADFMANAFPDDRQGRQDYPDDPAGALTGAEVQWNENVR